MLVLDYWKKAKEIEDMGADSLCIKDMAGLLTPYAAEELCSTQGVYKAS